MPLTPKVIAETAMFAPTTAAAAAPRWSVRPFAALLVPVLLVGAASGASAAPAKKRTSKAVVAKSAKAVKPAVEDPLAAALRKATGLEIAPASATVDGPGARQRLLVTATMPDGSGYDVTDRVRFTTSNPKLARVSGGVVTPLADGVLRVRARLGTLQSDLTDVTIANAGAPRVIEFVNDVAPILSKTGCNSTACHGSPAGKGGFKLSLFGYEPDLDFNAIVKDAEGKRVA